LEHRKIENSPFDPFVKWFFPKLLRFVPKWMSANVISVLGIFIAMFAGLSMAISGAFADIATARFFYLMGAFFVLLTWVTDTMDGVVARARNQLTKTGYYLDHFGDALATVFIGLGTSPPTAPTSDRFFCVTVYMLFHVHMHIRKSQLKVMELPFFGPTETRFMIIAVIIIQTFTASASSGSSFRS
jgi:phosphatidylglycerophosphate synthase